jgi:hypothetical protein
MALGSKARVNLCGLKFQRDRRKFEQCPSKPMFRWDGGPTVMPDYDAGDVAYNMGKGLLVISDW